MPESLFSELNRSAVASVAPLAVRMRPRTLDEILGQDKVIGEGTWLRRAVLEDSLMPIILYGPAGTGKTTIAKVIASETSARFEEVSAVSGGVADLRKVIDAARKELMIEGRKTILFVDEIHRFSRSQQDALLHAVEDHIVILIGATTENPYFEVNSALLSRSRIVELDPLAQDDIVKLLRLAVDDPRGLGSRCSITSAALGMIALNSGGDARAALTTLELASDIAKRADELTQGDLDEIESDELVALPIAKPVITVSVVSEASPRTALRYDKDGDEHYDIISAFIKSMRGSDPDAAVYWLARMIDGGEDPKFIARRIFILASEDIGNADPNAISVAAAAFKAAESIGYPECRINLAQAAIYMALAPKSNSVIMAIDSAMSEVRNGPARAVPSYLRDRHRPGSENYGSYEYPHNDPAGWVEQRYLPEGLEKGDFYQPGERGWEAYRTDAVTRDRD
ncbi:MAG: replication-associated recombination protein A [bacterium]|nr:replication-associated recombination protein A [bacterium]